jgi:GTPase involved in cell partitioning and DNA repair
MINKTASMLSMDITDDERNAARESIKALEQFLKELWAARQKDKVLVNILEKNKDVDPKSLFEIRHLLRRYQREVKDRYVNLIFNFAGKKDDNFQVISEGYIHKLIPLEKDTVTRQMKESLQDSMQQLAEFIEEFIDEFENFDDPEQINKIVNVSQKIDMMAKSVENVVDNQIKPHFEKNILKRKKVSEIRRHIIKRARLIKMLGE